LSKKQAARERIDRLLADRSPVYAALTGAEPKSRKNAARLLGALASSGDAAALVAALRAETTRFVVPSILLALGNIGSDTAKAALEAYAVPTPADESEAKHVEEIREAKKKARSPRWNATCRCPSKKRSSPQRMFWPFPRPDLPRFCKRNYQHSDFQASRQRQAFWFQPQTLRASTARAGLTEALIPVAESLPLDAAVIAKAADKTLVRPYRVELRGYPGERTVFIPGADHALKGEDNPSRYLDELRVVCHGSGLCDVFVKPCNVPDHRFDYRRQAISASIAPSAAACLARYALSFLPDSGGRIRVFDPFCGSGTLLFELEKAAPGSVLLGTDLSATALFAARTNAKAARSRAQFIQRDILRFEPKEPFDLVLTNMPFGNRVGSHETNEPLYRGFVHLLPKLLIPGGVALLYTMEHRLLVACLKSERSLTVAAELTTEAGGLNPRVTVVRHR
jgi:hypothetical protein